MNLVALPGSSSKGKTGFASRLTSVFIAFSLVATMTILPVKKAEAATTTIQVPVTYKQTEARKMLQMINDFRASNAKCWNESDTEQVAYSGLSPLAYDYKLEQTAMLRAAELAVKYSHTRPNGELCFSAWNQSWYAVAENIAAGQRSAQEVFIDWREDNEKYDGQGHRRNMLSDDVTAVGLACVEVDGIRYWVQNFSDPNSGADETAALDSEKGVSIEIEQNDVLEKKLSLPSSKITLKAGESKTLPKANFYIEMDSTLWFGGNFVLSNAAWKSSNSAVAAVSGSKVVAKKSGTATLTATANGVSAKLTVTVSPVIPAKPTISSAKSTAKKKMVVKWKKPSKSNLSNITGFEVLCSTSKTFKSGKVTKTAKKNATSYTVKSLKSKKRYYVKIRSINKVNGATSYSSWSKVKTVIVK